MKIKFQEIKDGGYGYHVTDALIEKKIEKNCKSTLGLIKSFKTRSKPLKMPMKRSSSSSSYEKGIIFDNTIETPKVMLIYIKLVFFKNKRKIIQNETTMYYIYSNIYIKSS